MYQLALNLFGWLFLLLIKQCYNYNIIVNFPLYKHAKDVGAI